MKTLTTSEGKFLTKFLPRYVEYMSRHRASLLSRFCGFHAITLYNLTIHFMVMQSVFLTTRKVHERYDLKGSFVDRHAQKGATRNSKGKAAATRRGAFRNVVFKDNDLNRTVRLAQQDREHFLQQVKNDAFFLRDWSVNTDDDEEYERRSVCVACGDVVLMFLTSFVACSLFPFCPATSWIILCCWVFTTRVTRCL